MRMFGTTTVNGRLKDSSGSTAGLLHGDFRMDNLGFHPIEGRQWPVAGWKFYIAFSLFRGVSILAGVAVDISWVMHQVESALKMQGKKPMVLYKLRGLIYKGKMFCHNPPSVTKGKDEGLENGGRFIPNKK
ncbi:hypothetical protein HanLR1_Chr16g0637181 [Helianthus annuus]|nr:hypothetical protein HanHA89_Chr16g0678041 [Helianthus annuus]KAJ0642338.1 hypothetical protein HanLR1_Chr16g0637181 [Helianthus annuus]